jgi:hypothetical protein
MNNNDNINTAKNKNNKKESNLVNLGNDISKKEIMKTRKSIINYIKSLDFLSNKQVNREYKIDNSNGHLLIHFSIILSEEVETIINFISTLERKVSFSILATDTNNLVLRFNI